MEQAVEGGGGEQRIVEGGGHSSSARFDVMMSAPRS
jgi:hypothetical protein